MKNTSGGNPRQFYINYVVCKFTIVVIRSNIEPHFILTKCKESWNNSCN
ncbi:hypothetical protein KWR11_019235 [Clostridioides difficile]|nr:hypothetical protein [Clostridioides difficile]MBY2047837.1 hypothetical protein [Clostridioides difficile]MBZ1287741.1 hypothetical protein [Clostridioides difficile]HBG1896361.1 hypothetical protein [Clostridioides difficile]HDF5622145.1 hypothetical protein [Clostridioides difficile]HDN2514109.1 hypothetical protein [Clostridioides difficile]